MIVKIYQILKKLFWGYTHKSEENITQYSNKTMGITFSLDPESLDIDILCYIPDLLVQQLENDDDNISNQDIEKIQKLANDFAQLLFLINKGLFKTQIFEYLEDKKKNANNPKTTLFIDNIISYYDIVKKEYNRIKIHDNEPVVRPFIAFKQYQ